MKNFKLFLITTCLLAWCISLMSQAQQICGTDEIHQTRLQTDPGYASQYNLVNNNVQSLVMQNKRTQGLSSMPIIYIPVVVHVVHLGEAVGTGTNVSDASINAMLADLNSRFANGNGNGVNMNVQFCLAVRDPNNNATTGITRHNLSSNAAYAANGVGYAQPSACGGIPDTIVKDLSDWSCASYYNIWIVKQICDAGGYATLPWAVAARDGIVIGAGSMTNGQLFAHETGHWLNLLHTFQGQNGSTCPPNANCLTDGDQVCDTPPILQSECGATSTCSTGSLLNATANYMGYCFATWDRFTQGQKDRVAACLSTYPRNLLLNSLGCVPLSPNDAGISAISNPANNATYSTQCGGANYNTAPVVTLTNYGTSTLTSVSIKYKIDNNAASTYSWSGSLAAFTSANVTLPSVSIPQGAHTFQAYTTLPNGATDGYNLNDSSSVSVTINGPTAITATTSQTNTTCAGNNGTATVNPSGGTLQTLVNNLTDFETPHGWTIVNGSQSNVWCAGTAAPYAGANSIYISAAANACANNNQTGALYSTVHFYKDFTFPANASNIQLSFNWRNASGVNSSFQVDSSDYFETYLVGTGTTPVAGNKLASGKLSGKYSNKLAWSLATVGGLDANAGTTKRLVFTWDNDWYASNPAANIDNINISYTQTFTYTYAWSNGQTTQTATGLAPGTYTCTISDANGCTATKSVTIINGCAGVTITAGGPTTFCQGGSVVLTSSLPSGNVWSNGATTQSITVTTSGSYSCTNGANTSNTIVVTVNPIPATPTVTNSGALTFCQGGSVTLTSSSATGNTWSPGGATTQSINVTTSGSYTVTVTSNGCTSSPSAAKVVTVNPIPATPTVTNSGALTFCQGGSVTLTSSSATGNTWSPGGATTQSINVTTSGSYTVTVTANGCTSSPSAAKVVTVNPIPATPTISASGPTTFCTGGSVTLTSSAASGNLWSTGASTQSINVTTAGSYVVTVTSNGCTSSPSAATNVTVNNCSVSISANGPTTFCQGGSVILTSSQPTGNLWSNGATTQSITVTTSGSFSCTYNGNTSNTIVVTVNPLPNATISASNGLTFCQGSATVLTVPIPGGTTQTWTKDGVFFATAFNPLVTDPGVYGVTVTTAATGCTATSSVTVTVNPIPATPTISAGGPTTFCQGGSVTLTSSSASGNQWSTGATTQSINVTTSGNYTVAVTSNGCTSSPSAATSVTVQVCGSVTITAGGPTTFCSGGSVVLTSSIAAGNVWSNGATTQSITVTTSGSYNCTNGGSTSNTIVVNVNPAPPTATTQTGTVSLCSGTLVSGPATGNAAILDGSNDNISIVNNISSATSFTFELWVYPLSSAISQRLLELSSSSTNYMYCAAYDVSGKPRFGFSSGGGGEQVIPSSVALTANAWNHLAVTLTGGVGKIYINGNLTGTNAAMTVSPASIGATINNFLGNSTLFGTPINGYIDEVRFWNVARSQTAIQNNMSKTLPPSTSGLVAYYRLDESSGTSVLESVSGTSTGTANNGATWQVPSTVPWNVAGYLWSNGATSQGINLTTSGTYTLTVTNVAGCAASSAPIVATVKPKPSATITASGSTTICTGQTVQLSAPGRGNALQFDGNDDYVECATPIIPTSGNYSILFWAKESVAQGGYREIVSQGRNFYLGRDNTGIIRVGDNWLNTGVAWPTDLQWHHYAVTRSGTNTWLYIDGNLVATKGSAIGSPIVVGGTSNLFVIGDQFQPDDESFVRVDDITIWSTVRSINSRFKRP